MTNLFVGAGLRFLIIFLVGGGWAYRHLKVRKKTEEQEEDFSNYPINEQGQYPWEWDIDNSPERISKNAKPYKRKVGIRSRRW